MNISQLVFAAALGLSPAGGIAWAQLGDAQSVSIPTPKFNRHYLQQAIQIQVTDKGLKYFEKNMDKLIAGAGVSLNQGELPEISYTFGKPMEFHELGLDTETEQLLRQTVAMFQTWVVGNPLRANLQPTFQVDKSNYVATFDKLSIVTRPDLLQVYGLKSGIVLLLDLGLKDLKLTTPSIRIFDQRMPDLGQVEVKDLEARLGGDQLQARVRVPFHVTVDANHNIEFQALKIEQNLNDVPISIKYRDLMLPQLAISINGKSFSINMEKLKSQLNENLPAAIARSKAEIIRFAEEQLPAEINKMAKGVLQGNLEEVSRLDPPGSEGDTPFYWGFQLAKLNQGKFGLNMALNAFVEDPKNSRSQPDPEANGSVDPDLSSLDGAKFDVILSINQGVINRVMQLSFERNLFSALDTGSGAMRLTQTPVISAPARNLGLAVGRGETLMRVRVQGNVPRGLVKGTQTLGIQDGFELAFDLIAMLRKAKGGGVEVVFRSIDLDTLWINPDHVTWLGKVMGAEGTVREELQKVVDGWAQREMKLPGVFPIPPEVMGIKLEIDDMTMSRTGHLLMFLNYRQR